MKIALIGCGKQALKHVGGLRKCRDVEIVLVDKEPALARALGEREGLAWRASVDDVLSDRAVTAVDLCVPTPFHAPLIRRALAAGKDFFCEKPLCETAVEAREINQLARHGLRVGIVGYVYRHVPVLQRARSILEGVGESGTSPVIGRISLALMRIGGRGSAALWKHRRKEGGGVINEMLVHMLDLAVWYFGPVARAELLMEGVFRPERMINGNSEKVDAEDFALVRLSTRAGIPVVVQADLLTPSFTQAIEVQGDNGTLMASIQPDMPRFVFTLKAAGGYPAGRTELAGEEVNFFDAEMADFVAAVRERRPPQVGTLADSVSVMDAIEMIRGSGRTRSTT